jgi:leucyl/phenylalanyl-tRNA---protein transferase
LTSLLDPSLLIAAYSQGYFPMARSRFSRRVDFYEPRERAIIPLEGFHMSRSLHKLWKKQPFVITVDHAFESVIQHCADIPRHTENTWINQTIIDSYCELHRLGFAHSVECWKEGKLAGGLYGVTLGAAFFGESMFSYLSNASKIALVYLVERLKERHYRLLDSQFINPHMKQFGTIEISNADYREKLKEALQHNASFN